MFGSGLTQGLEHIFYHISLHCLRVPFGQPACSGSPSFPRHLFNLTFTSLTPNFPALAWRRGSIHIFSLNDSFPVMEELEEITRPSAFLWHKVLLNCFTGIIGLRVPESKWWKMSQKSSQETSKCHCCGGRVMGDPFSPLEKAKAAWLRYWLPSSAVELCNSLQNLSAPFFFFPQTFVLYAAALIRGNRNNCTQFSRKLDWLVSKLERLESSSGNFGGNIDGFSLDWIAVRALQCYKMAACSGCSDNWKYFLRSLRNPGSPPLYLGWESRGFEHHSESSH